VFSLIENTRGALLCVSDLLHEKLKKEIEVEFDLASGHVGKFPPSAMKPSDALGAMGFTSNRCTSFFGFVDLIYYSDTFEMLKFINT
jgi:hypothetical protein